MSTKNYQKFEKLKEYDKKNCKNVYYMKRQNSKPVKNDHSGLLMLTNHQLSAFKKLAVALGDEALDQG